ncbi:MAG: phosphoribosyl-ATP diphosphatase [Oscillospiraceae bacterium]|jgi:phosphoribosyl-ATP pyrophosphohydrolase|nr:phosphoribosyl-ATP diphosphatase [Oscillospiraceae bacterium]
MNDILGNLYNTVVDRQQNPQEGSYTCYLFEKGLDKILKKIGEESAETIIAAKNQDNGELVGEVGDLLYHLMVMLVEKGVPIEAVNAELRKRSLKSGNLKQMKQVDKNS